ncbi:MAG TPA: RNA polymerase sigma factor [Bryobacteraceae bacterium]|jgi:RNA polymerase sigma-70 factor (ECF subfamily)|nr:RNA polymerase sigma factor [Bryobacteraceae bacterium]
MHDAAETVSAILPDARSEPRDEAGLIRAAQSGDHDAFERLVRAHDRGVLRLAMNLLGSADEARDVYQEAFLKVYRNLHSFRFDCLFHTWLYRIVTNICLDHLRRRKVRKEESTVVDTEEGPVDRAIQMEERNPAGNPERQMWNRELNARIGHALDALTPRERTVFELRHYEGLRLRAIGEIIGTSEEAAKNCLFRATQKMRASLETFV